MKKKQPSLQYYDIVAYGPHVFFTRFAEYVVTTLEADGVSIGHHSFMTQVLDELPLLAAERGAKDVNFAIDSIPLGGINFTRNEASGGKVTIQPGRKDCFYKFSGMTKHPVYCGTISIITIEFGRILPLQATIVAAYNSAEARQFVASYYSAKRERLRGRHCIVNFNGDRIDDFREMSWGDIIMAPGLLSDIRDEMDSFFSGFDMYKDRNLSWRRGMLLAGPPGNGKTAICRAVATAAKVPVIYCATTDADLFGMLSQVQVTMVQHAPCILVFEDADSVGGDDIMRSAMLNMMDGMFSCDGVFTIATTNCPEKLTSAISGRPSRFDSFYVIGNPGPDERRKILISKLGKSAKDLPPKDVDKVVLDTGDMSAACLQEIAICALKASMAKKGKLLPAYVHAAVNRVKKHISISRDGLDMMSRGFAGFSMNNDEPRGLQTKYPKN